MFTKYKCINTYLSHLKMSSKTVTPLLVFPQLLIYHTMVSTIITINLYSRYRVELLYIVKIYISVFWNQILSILIILFNKSEILFCSHLFIIKNVAIYI
jgi:hypothetical protein